VEYRFRFHKFLTGHLMEVSGQLQDTQKGPPATAHKAEGAKAPVWDVFGEEKILTSLSEIKSQII
jgi:hypothetical protein